MEKKMIPEIEEYNPKMTTKERRSFLLSTVASHMVIFKTTYGEALSAVYRIFKGNEFLREYIEQVSNGGRTGNKFENDVMKEYWRLGGKVGNMEGSK